MIITASDDESDGTIDEHVQALHALKLDSTRIYLSAVQCTESATRIPALLARFPNRSVLTSLCQQHLGDFVSILAELPDRIFYSRCFNTELADALPETPLLDASCTMEYRFPTGDSLPIPPCGDSAPCWRIVADERACSEAPYLRRDVRPLEARLPRGTMIVGNCLAQ